MSQTWVSNGTVADFNTQVGNAANGDTVTIAAGDWVWASSPNTINKAITIQGFGSGRVIAFSSSSATIGIGVQTFALNLSGLALVNGDSITVYRAGGRQNGGFPTVQPWMKGTITSYLGVTLVLNITSTNDTPTNGTYHDWYFVTELTATTRTTITANNGSSVLFTLNENVAGNVVFTGIRLINGSGTNDLINFIYTSGGQPILLHDCLFQSSISTSDCIQSSTNRGVIWNTDFIATPFSAAQLAVHLIDAPATSWTTPSTMGNLDISGTSNLYLEDCNFVSWINATDFDNNARAVIRHSNVYTASIGTHGPDTSNYGVRHFEVYNNSIIWNGFGDGSTIPFSRMFYVRGGTYVITDNVINVPTGSDFGNKPCVDMTVMNLQRNAGPNPCWGLNYSVTGQYYHVPRQVGFGYVNGTGFSNYGSVSGSTDSITYVGDSEPAYFWNNSGTNTIQTNALTYLQSDFGTGNGCIGVQDTTAAYVISGRDFFFKGVGRPGYVKYTYPHPLRGNINVNLPHYVRLAAYLRIGFYT